MDQEEKPNIIGDNSGTSVLPILKNRPKKLFVLIVFLGLLFVSVVTLVLISKANKLNSSRLNARQISESPTPIKTMAPKVGPVNISFSPEIGAKTKNQPFLVEVKIQSEVAKTVGVADFDIQFDGAVFNASEVSCGTDFPSVGFARVVGNIINLTCYNFGGVSLSPNIPVTVGKFSLQVRDDAPTGSTGPVTFIRQIVAEKGTANDLVGQSLGASFTTY